MNLIESSPIQWGLACSIFLGVTCSMVMSFDCYSYGKKVVVVSCQLAWIMGIPEDWGKMEHV